MFPVEPRGSIPAAPASSQGWFVTIGLTDFEAAPERYAALVEGSWWAPDSLVAVVGVPDTAAVRIGSAAGPRFDPLHFEWASTDPSVARGSVHVTTPQGLLVRDLDEALRSIGERLLGDLP